MQTKNEKAVVFPHKVKKHARDMKIWSFTLLKPYLSSKLHNHQNQTALHLFQESLDNTISATSLQASGYLSLAASSKGAVCIPGKSGKFAL